MMKHRGALGTCLVFGLGLAACGQSKTYPIKPTSVTCPGTDLTVCDLKLETSTRHPQAGSTIALHNVVVTTPTVTLDLGNGNGSVNAFFVQDADSNTTFGGAYAGILVTYDPTQVARTSVPQLFERIEVDGKFDSMGSASTPTKVVRASNIQPMGDKVTIVPVVIDRADLVDTGGEKAAAYEGVLIRLREVSITEPTVSANGVSVNGAFRVNESLVIEGSMYTYAAPKVDTQFTSLSGVLHLCASGPMVGRSVLTPRFATDLVDKNANSLVTTIVDINDPNSPGHPLEGCANLTGSQTVGKCANAHLTNVVVTAVNGYISSKLKALWVQDDSIDDGQFSGIMVSYNPNNTPYIPNVGDRVNVDGQIIEYKRGRQIQYPTITQGQGTGNIQPVVVSPDDIAETVAPETSAYQGVLVEIQGVDVTTVCVQDTKGRDFGNFVVADEVYIASTFQLTYEGSFYSTGMCLTPEGEPSGLCGCSAHPRPGDQRKMGDHFTSITGVMTYANNIYQLAPRVDGDLVH
jgi:predicted extracellular nuclease